MSFIKIIGAASGIGAKDNKCADGPLYIKDHINKKEEFFSKFSWETTLYPKEDLLKNMDRVSDFCIRLARETYNLSQEDKKCAILGGDHSCAIGTWSGIARAVRNKGDIGLIWIDAHMDAHTPKTTESGNIHGMPLAVLLGYGDPYLTNICSFSPKIKPQNICLIGIRSYELGEAYFLESLGVKIYFIEEVHQRGIKNILRESLIYVTENTIGYGLSIDLDVFDPVQVPGTSLPVDNGIDVKEFIEALFQFNNDPKLLATEIAEYNPYLDKENVTAQIILDILDKIYFK